MSTSMGAPPAKTSLKAVIEAAARRHDRRQAARAVMMASAADTAPLSDAAQRFALLELV